MDLIHSETPHYGRRLQDFPDTRTITDRIVRWIVQRDTVLFEAALGCNGVINAILTVTTDESGQPVAPFLNTSLKWLEFEQTSWTLFLLAYAAITLVALVHGQVTGNAYAIRSGVQVIGTIFQAAIAVAILTSPMAPAAGLRYGATAFWSFVIASVLIIKHDVRAKAARERGVS